MTGHSFVKARYDDDVKYSELVVRGVMKERKNLQYGLIFNWVQYFTQIGGFDAIINMLELGLNDEKAVKIPFSLVSQVMRPFRCLNSTLTPEFSKIFATRISDIIVKRLSTLSE
jgi:hypothetical protein